MSYRRIAYVTPSAQNVAQKAILSFFCNKSQLQADKVCYKVSLCGKFQRLVVVH